MWTYVENSCFTCPSNTEQNCSQMAIVLHFQNCKIFPNTGQGDFCEHEGIVKVIYQTYFRNLDGSLSKS